MSPHARAASRRSLIALSLLALIACAAALPGCARKSSSGGAPAVQPVLGISPDWVSTNTGKSRDLQVYLAGSGEPYRGEILWSAEGGEIAAFAGEGLARYTGGGVQGVYDIRAELPELGIEFISSIFLATYDFSYENPFVIAGDDDSGPAAAAALSGPWAAFADSGADSGVRVRRLDLVSGQIRVSPPLEAEFGAPLGIELLAGGEPVALFAPLPGSDLHSLVQFDDSLSPVAILAEFPSASVPHLALDSTGALLLSRTPLPPGGGGSGTEIIRIELDPAGIPFEEVLFSILPSQVRGLACGPDGILYIATSATVRRYELDGRALDPAAPFHTELQGLITDIEADAEGAIYVAGTEETGVRVLGETGHEVAAFGEYGGPFGFVRGDANGDGIVDTLDLEVVIDVLLGGPAPCRKALDCNADRRIDVRDYLFLNEFLVFGGAAPPAPFPECGGDPDSESPFSCATGTCEGLRDFHDILALAADPFGDPGAPSRLLAVDDWIAEDSAAVAIVLTPEVGTPPLATAPPEELRYPVVEPFVAGEAARPLHPIAGGGTPELFTISPPLPAGLAIDPLTGVISGTPDAASPPSLHTVTAENAAGWATTDVEIAVSAAP